MNLLLISKILQIVLSTILVLFILVQSKGGGLSSSVSGGFSAYRSKRGVEKFIFVSTIILSVLVAINSLLIITLS
jgi:preprotein translocase subunit SecG